MHATNLRGSRLSREHFWRRRDLTHPLKEFTHKYGLDSEGKEKGRDLQPFLFVLVALAELYTLRR